MVQQWRVRSNLYKVKLSSITLSTGFPSDCFFFFVCLFFNMPLQCKRTTYKISRPPPGFSKVLKTLSAASTRDELLAFLQQYGSHYVSEALYGSELSCSIYFPSKKAQQQLWLQYQKGECRRWRQSKSQAAAKFE